MKIAVEEVRSSDGWLVKLGRLGYAVKGVVYIVVGFIATKSAMGMSGGETTDSQGAVQRIGSEPYGLLLLVIVAVGLLGYAAWRLVSAVTDAERRGDEPSSLALRAGEAARGLIYGSLGAWTARYVVTQRADRGEETSGVVATALGLPYGRWIVAGAGIGVIAYALYQVYRALSGKFMRRLDFSGATLSARKWTERFGRFGILARAIVFSIIGFLTVRAGWNYNPSAAGGMERSLDVIAREQSSYMFVAIAVGLIAYGLFEIATARYRVMRAR
jgi:hypothetical protein